MILQGDARHLPLADRTVQCVVTSPPYWGLRDYKTEPLVWGGDAGCVHDFASETVSTEIGRGNWTQGVNGRGERQSGGVTAAREPIRAVQQRGFCRTCGAWRGSLGLEPTPELYVDHVVGIFREVRRVLKDDGVLWLNIGDSYASQGGGGLGKQGATSARRGRTNVGEQPSGSRCPLGLKPKDLVGTPWMLAFALRADGWYLRAEIIWAKGISFCPTYSGSVMPESVTDRPTKAHEQVFLLTKSERYCYNAEVVKEIGSVPEGALGGKGSGFRAGHRRGSHPELRRDREPNVYWNYTGKRNLRSVWAINPQPFSGAHYATFPMALVEPMVKAASRPRDTVLDPFCGSGTAGIVALRLGRRFVGIDVAAGYTTMARHEIHRPLFTGAIQ